MEDERTTTMRALVKAILQRAEQYTWEVPANGRLTLMLEPNVAVINVFHSKYRVPNSTAIHSHTVDFRSDIVGGVMRQYRYRRVAIDARDSPVAPVIEDARDGPKAFGTENAGRGPAPRGVASWISKYWEQELTIGGKLAGEPAECYLEQSEIETYRAGEHYEITADEIHQSVPEDGTVTLISRQYKMSATSVSTFWPWAPMAEGAKPSEKVIPAAAVAEVIREVIAVALERCF